MEGAVGTVELPCGSDFLVTGIGGFPCGAGAGEFPCAADFLVADASVSRQCPTQPRSAPTQATVTDLSKSHLIVTGTSPPRVTLVLERLLSLDFNWC